jgi:Arc/MetJ-type ribon-helix-helix transcriptional regulator
MASSQRSHLEDRTASERVTLRVSPALLAAIDTAVEAGEYPNRSEAIREPLREVFENGPADE